MEKITSSAPFSPDRLDQVDALTLLQSLPDGSVDLMVTDPAYNGMNQHLGLGSGRIVGEYANKADGDWFSEFDDNPEGVYRDFLNETRRVLGQDKGVFLMFDPFSLMTLAPIVREVLDVKNLITWDKVNIGMGYNFRRRTEFILFCTTGKVKLSRKDIPDVWRIPRLHNAQYPTQKPVELFEAMISSVFGHEAAGKTVIDPFMGSGASMVASRRQGANYIGGDISEAAIDLAAGRYQDMYNDPAQPRDARAKELPMKPFWEETRVQVTHPDSSSRGWVTRRRETDSDTLNN